MNLSPFKIWILATRPQTLPASVAPVILGTAMAWGDGVSHWPSAWLALLGALCLQVGTNLVNDYFDFKNGVDTEDRLGPLRVVQTGLVHPRRMMCAVALVFGFAALISSLLVLRAGWPIAVIAVTSILSAIFYTAGPHPLGYIGLGEALVFIFFGPVAVMGTYYVQSFEMHAGVFWAGIAAGCFSSAILVVNNLRDIETDRRSRKKTLAVRFGASFARREYLTFIFTGSFVPVLLYLIINDHRWILLSPLVFFFAFPCLEAVFTRTDGPALNKTLAQTGLLLIVFTVLFSIGWSL
ncbi:MAG TPA: 1,4-dihydroxy-2-naphthoate polyprenyltransferase [Candidatus Omnitrophota bacterium]|nr:1,4-dihydroxy-2-naphthoate polyprenyltransferase [Candidatus Omnitrophota bacterium]